MIMPPKKDSLVRVRIIALLEEPHMQSPVVILHDPKSDRVLPIWIGEPEARAIAIVLQRLDLGRPLTHTLMVNMIKDFKGKVTKVVVEKMEGGTYFASISVKIGRGKEHVIDARPSDSIALALEAEAPIYIAGSLLDEAGQENPFPSETIEDAEKAVKKGKAKSKFSKGETEKLKALLKKAREREQSGGRSK